jgi:hypothetical protein
MQLIGMKLLSRFSAKGVLFIAFVSICAIASISFSEAMATGPESNGRTAYSDLIATGNSLMKENKFTDAFSIASQAIQLDSRRFEGYLLAATAQYNSGNSEQGKKYMSDALQRVPSGKKAKLQAVAAELEKAPAVAISDAELVRKTDVLKLILADANKATSQNEHEIRLAEYLKQSDQLLRLNSNLAEVWATRAAIGLELNQAHVGWQAGHRLIELRADAGGDAKIGELMAKLDRRGWLEIRDPDELARDAALENRKNRLIKYVGHWVPTTNKDDDYVGPLITKTGYIDITLQGGHDLKVQGEFYYEFGKTYYSGFKKCFYGSIRKVKVSGIRLMTRLDSDNKLKEYLDDVGGADFDHFLLTGEFEFAVEPSFGGALFKNRKDLSSWKFHASDTTALLSSPDADAKGISHMFLCPVSGLRDFNDLFLDLVKK